MEKIDPCSPKSTLILELIKYHFEEGWEMEYLQYICNIIILIGGAIMAVKGIADFFGKPIGLFKKKNEAEFEKKVVKIINKIMPELFLAHDLETRDKYRKDRENYLQEIKSEVLKSIQAELGQVGELTQQYETLAISAKDVLREKIMAIYHKNKKDRTLSYHEKEALDQYYKDYKSINGNSYIDKYYTRMKDWRVIDEDYDQDSAL